MYTRDENLLKFCTTDNQIKKMEAIWAAGSIREAARVLGLSYSNVQEVWSKIHKKAAKAGYAPEQGLSKPVAPGFEIAKQSTMYNGDGEVLVEWITRTAKSEHTELVREQLVESLKEDVSPTPAIQGPEKFKDELASVIPVGDHHFGMYAWREEAGGDYNTEMAGEYLKAGIKYLVDNTPSTSLCVLATLGDLLHYDSKKPVTPASGHHLDSDSRAARMVKEAIKAVRWGIDYCAQKNDKVHVIFETGNHDEFSTIFFQEAFSLFYEDNPRITVDTSPRNIHVVEFGKNMITTHHGDKIKLRELPLVFAADYPEIWGRTKYRVCHTGHIHTDKVIVDERGGMKAESHRILAPRDEYAQSHGWRSGQGLKSIIYHKEFGEVSRMNVHPEMF